MPTFATFEGERTVDEIADRLFTRLTPRQRETATAAILRANPQLDRIRELPQGAVIEVPDIPALRAKATALNESPDRTTLKLLDTAMRAYVERLQERHSRDEQEVKAQAALVRSSQFNQLISRSQELVALAKEAGEALDARMETSAARQKAVSVAAERASAEIDALMNRK